MLTLGTSYAYAMDASGNNRTSDDAPAVVASSRTFLPTNERRIARAYDDEVSRSDYRDGISTTNTGTWSDDVENFDIAYQQTPDQKSSMAKLKSEMNEGNQTYISSENQLEASDNHLRTDLQSALSKANSLVGNVESASADMDAQTNTISTLVTSITNAQAKKQADDLASSESNSTVSKQTRQQITDAFDTWTGTHTDATMGQKVLAYAMQYNGYPYVWGATGPSSFDCSGLVMFSYAHFGIALPHFSGSQAEMGVEVPPSSVQPGDIVANDEHAALYYGKINGVDYVFNALNPSAGVTFTPLHVAFSSSYHIRRVY